MFIYEELKRRNMVDNIKEFNELIWNREIKINDKIINSSISFKKNDVKKIKVGILEFYV